MRWYAEMRRGRTDALMMSRAAVMSTRQQQQGFGMPPHHLAQNGTSMPLLFLLLMAPQPRPAPTGLLFMPSDTHSSQRSTFQPAALLGLPQGQRMSSCLPFLVAARMPTL